MKVVVNGCFGGFSISTEARSRGREISGNPKWGRGLRDIQRDDPVLVQVVEELGKQANGRFSSLCIVDVPEDVSWHIEEYDGMEHVAEDHRTWTP